jgi:hypothetical protein
MKIVRVAVVQDSPVVFDKEATWAKTEKLLQDAAEKEHRWSCFQRLSFPHIPRASTSGLGWECDFLVGETTICVTSRAPWKFPEKLPAFLEKLLRNKVCILLSE